MSSFPHSLASPLASPDRVSPHPSLERSQSTRTRQDRNPIDQGMSFACLSPRRRVCFHTMPHSSEHEWSRSPISFRPAGTASRAAFVAQNQRERILAAVADVVSVVGYGEMSVEDVIVTAGVSRRTFYEHFSNKHDAFLAAYDTVVAQLLGGVRHAYESETHLLRAARVRPDGIPGLRRPRAGVRAHVHRRGARRRPRGGQAPQRRDGGVRHADRRERARARHGARASGAHGRDDRRRHLRGHLRTHRRRARSAASRPCCRTSSTPRCCRTWASMPQRRSISVGAKRSNATD